jgi:hypothetical protein
VAGSVWQVRVATSACVLFVPGLAVAVTVIFEWLSRRPDRPALLGATLAVLFGNGAGWSAVALPLRAVTAGPARDARSGRPADCFEPSNLAALAALPPGLVLSTVDPGPAILAHTDHSVLAGPYHRNTDGIRVSLLSLAAPPERARSLIAEARVRYVALCRVSNETSETVSLHPDSLSAALLAGHTPAWLRPVGPRDGAYLLFEVDPSQR